MQQIPAVLDKKGDAGYTKNQIWKNVEGKVFSCGFTENGRMVQAPKPAGKTAVPESGAESRCVSRVKGP